jgi:hypothetical protein
VTYATTAGSASPGSDFGASGGTLVFLSGETSKTIGVSVVGDTSVEPSETLNLTLTGPVNATLAVAAAIGTITNDDIPPPPPSGWDAGTAVGVSRSQSSYDIYNGNAALNDSGFGAAVWTESSTSSGTTNRIWTNRYENGTWGTPTEIGGTDSLAPKIALSPSGSAIATWSERGHDANGNIVNATILARVHDGGTWGPPIRISDAAPATPLVFFALAPVVIWDTATTALVAWYQDDPATPSTSIWISRFDGSVWAAPVRISSGAHVTRNPVLATDSAGRSVIAWSQDTNPYDSSQPAGYETPNVWASVYNFGVWNTPQQIGRSDQVNFESAVANGVAMNTGGSAVVMVRDNHNGVNSVLAVRYDPATENWTAPEILGAGFDVDRAQVDLDAGGNAIAVWMSRPSGPSALYNLALSRYDATTMTWSSPVLVEDPAKDIFAPHVGMDDSGNAMITWDAVDDSVVRARRYFAASGLAANSTNLGIDGENALAVNASGQALCTGDDLSYSPTMFLTTIRGFIYTP